MFTVRAARQTNCLYVLRMIVKLAYTLAANCTQFPDEDFCRKRLDFNILSNF